jgi:amidohydrolase
LDVESEVEDHIEELVRLRRWFHMHPEPGFQEFKTSKKIAEYLMDLGFMVETGVAETGVVAVMEGAGDGPTLLMRSDMDALPIDEDNDLPYRSVNAGMMHACGHDAHMAMLLVAAKILRNHRDSVNGRVKFVFQPNEEEAGAERMVEEGVMADPDVDAALGMHIWTQIPTGTIGVVSGPVMASSYYFKLRIIGKGGHGGAPHTAVDPILCASHVVQAVQAIQTREVSALEPTVITFGKIHGGSFNIVIPEEVELEGSIRCLHMKDAEVRNRFREVVESVCEAYRTNYELEFKCGNRLLSNDPDMTAMVEGVAADLVGGENVIGEEMRMMVGEDFAEFSLKVPSCFCFLGTGNPEKETDHPHHSPRFKIDEDSLPLGVEMHVRTALEYFSRNPARALIQ